MGGRNMSWGVERYFRYLLGCQDVCIHIISSVRGTRLSLRIREGGG